MSRFPVFDHERKPEIEIIDGLHTIVNERSVVQDFDPLELLDERVDFFATIPIRSVVTANAGPAFELGPFCLDSAEVIKLYNALAAHINTFTGEFRSTGRAS